MLYYQCKSTTFRALAASIHPECDLRNIEADPPSIVSDFDGCGLACDSISGNGIPPARATRTPTRSLAFRIRNRKNRSLYSGGPRLQQPAVRRHRTYRVDDSGLSLFGRRSIQSVRHL